MVAVPLYIPERGDAVWINFGPQAGHEQAGRRPAVVLSPGAYNGKVGLAVFCPITSRVKGYPFEVVLPKGIEVQGAVLSDQVRNLDWRARKAALICKLPEDVTREILWKLSTLISIA